MVQQLEPAEIEASVNEFQLKLDRLRVLYEQYFMGITKREPLVALKDVVRLQHLLDQQQIRNTGLRFRLRNLIQKFNVFRTYWARTNRQIAMGTYKRDVARVHRKYAKQGVDMPDLNEMRTPAAIERAMAEAAQQMREHKPDAPRRRRADQIRGGTPLGPDGPQPAEAAPTVAASDDAPLISTDEADAVLDAFFSDAVDPATAGTLDSPTAVAGRPKPRPAPIAPRAVPSAPATSSAPSSASSGSPASPRTRAPAPTAPPAAPSPTPAHGLGDETIRSLYRRMVKAKRMVGENPDTVTYEGLARTVTQQLPKLRQLHPGKQIDFQVVIRDGKVVLKAKPT